MKGTPLKPTIGNGKICYIEMPSTDVKSSGEFYQQVFGWNVRRRGDGSVAFDDGVGDVSGTWVTGRKPFEADGLTIHIMVDDIEATIGLVREHGGTILRGVGEHPP